MAYDLKQDSSSQSPAHQALIIIASRKFSSLWTKVRVHAHHECQATVRSTRRRKTAWSHTTPQVRESETFTVARQIFGVGPSHGHWNLSTSTIPRSHLCRCQTHQKALLPTLVLPPQRSSFTTMEVKPARTSLRAVMHRRVVTTHE